MTKKLVEVNDLYSGQYSINKNMRFKTSMLRSDLFDYGDAYIVVKETIHLLDAAANENHKADKDVAFENKALFRSCISKINITLIDNAEDLHLVMPVHNLLEYSQNYPITPGNF